MTPISIAEIDQLTVAIPKLNTSDAKFALDLVRYYKKYHTLSAKQIPWVLKLIARATQSKAEVPKIDVGGFEGVVALFNKAKEHLKYPKIVLLCEGKSVTLALAGPKSKEPGSINVMGEGKFPHREWFGRVSPDGVWSPSSMDPTFKVALQKLLEEFGKNPAEIAKLHGQLTGNCCFCNSALTDKNSTADGFGPVCADHYGLKDQWKGAVIKATLQEKAVTSVEEIQKNTGLDFEEITTIFSEKIEALKSEDGFDKFLSKLCFLCENAPGVVLKDEYMICQSCAHEMEL